MINTKIRIKNISIIDITNVIKYGYNWTYIKLNKGCITLFFIVSFISSLLIYSITKSYNLFEIV